MRAEIACEQTPVGQLLRCKPELGGDDEGLEQSLGDRIAEEEVAGFCTDGKLGEETRRVDTRRDHDRARLELVSALQCDHAVVADGPHVSELHVRQCS